MNEDKVKKAFKFPVEYGKDLGLEENDVKKLNLLWVEVGFMEFGSGKI